MSLRIYNRYKHSLPFEVDLEEDLVKDVEYAFIKRIPKSIVDNVSFKELGMLRDILKNIDSVIIDDNRDLWSRSKEHITVNQLSTGCKGILLLMLEKCKVLDTLELGQNAICYIILKCNKGSIILDSPMTWPIISQQLFETDILIDNNTKIDVIYEDRHFSTVGELNDYIEYGDD